MNEKYADIAALPHKEPRNRVRMPQQNRAAQFAPFATVYEAEAGCTVSCHCGEGCLGVLYIHKNPKLLK